MPQDSMWWRILKKKLDFGYTTKQDLGCCHGKLLFGSSCYTPSYLKIKLF